LPSLGTVLPEGVCAVKGFNAVDRFMELHNVLEICCSWKSQKLLHVDGSHCLVKFLATLPGVLWRHLEIIDECVVRNSVCQCLQRKQQACSKARFAMSIHSSQFEEFDVGSHDILHEHLDPAPG
jgi:hypothetical protein